MSIHKFSLSQGEVEKLGKSENDNDDLTKTIKYLQKTVENQQVLFGLTHAFQRVLLCSLHTFSVHHIHLVIEDLKFLFIIAFSLSQVELQKMVNEKQMTGMLQYMHFLTCLLIDHESF